MNRLSVMLLALLVLSGCATMQSKVADHVRPMVVEQELDSSELLDVAVVIFDSEELTDDEISELGLSEEIRRAEERYMPIQLKYTMQRFAQRQVVREILRGRTSAIRVLRHCSGKERPLPGRL